jgi:hypothetical protein
MLCFILRNIIINGFLHFYEDCYGIGKAGCYKRMFIASTGVIYMFTEDSMSSAGLAEDLRAESFIPPMFCQPLPILSAAVYRMLRYHVPVFCRGYCNCSFVVRPVPRADVWTAPDRRMVKSSFAGLSRPVEACPHVIPRSVL